MRFAEGGCGGDTVIADLRPIHVLMMPMALQGTRTPAVAIVKVAMEVSKNQDDVILLYFFPTLCQKLLSARDSCKPQNLFLVG